MSRESAEDTRAARQVLCNELGLNKTIVREIIDEKVALYLKQIGVEKLVEGAAIRCVNEMIREGRYDKDSIRTLASKAAQREVEGVIGPLLIAIGKTKS